MKVFAQFHIDCPSYFEVTLCIKPEKYSRRTCFQFYWLGRRIQEYIAGFVDEVYISFDAPNDAEYLGDFENISSNELLDAVKRFVVKKLKEAKD